MEGNGGAANLHLSHSALVTIMTVIDITLFTSPLFENNKSPIKFKKIQGAGL